MKRSFIIRWVALLGVFPVVGLAQEAVVTVHADQVVHRLSRYLTGACIEDVNHEVYGGIDSQMIFGESFAEPGPTPPLRDFATYGGSWTAAGDGSVQIPGGDGPKIVCDRAPFSEGEASVELRFKDKGGGNGGLIVKVSQPGKGADQFNGYEVALEPAGTLVLGRHRQNWEPLRRVPCEVPINQWITLAVRMTGNALEVLVNGKSMTRFEDTDHPLNTGAVGLRVWQREASFRNLSVNSGGDQRKYDFAYTTRGTWGQGVSGMWRPLRSGSAEGEFALDRNGAFSGRQSQRLAFQGGAGEIGIENQGLNRWGLCFLKGKTYEGYLWARADQPTDLFVALESRDGGQVYAEKRLRVTGPEWQRLDFAFKPKAADAGGRFAIKLKQASSVTLGYTFLQPGAWGRFKGLPVRKDVAEGLIHQGITVLRQGGCMVNANEYRWKKMIGPRAQRPPYVGWWYPHSSNGWGIFEFLQFCDAAFFLGVPDVNINETPQDMVDFIEYANGPANSEWGRKRAADGHPKPYHLKYLQIGNEEKVNEEYWQKFKPIAEAIWAKDSEIILVVGDFAYGHPIRDPFNITGAAGGMSSLAAQQKILRLAKEHNREVWFDIHIGTEGPRPDFGGSLSFIDAIDKLADGAKHRVVIFEFNAGNHSQRRALANAAAINGVERDGRLPIATSANCLQPDGQNDNDWDQGLLFLNPSQVWLQPPGYVTRMVSRNYQPLLVRSEAHSPGNSLDVSAKRNENGKTLILQVVNFSDGAVPATLSLRGFVPRENIVKVETLAGPLGTRNTADDPERIKTQFSDWRHDIRDGRTSYNFPANSFTVLKFQ